MYLRISEDKKADGLAIERQRGACLELVEQRGWTLAGEYADTVSAYLRDVKRPRYEAMREDFDAGRFDVLVVYDLDRLTRQPRELEDWIDAAEHRGLAIITANGEADLTTDGGRMYARIKAAVARGEIERKSARQRAKNAQLVEAGKPILGNRPFGFEADRETLREVEADMIREAVESVISGGSIGAVVKAWNESGVEPTSKRAIKNGKRTWSHAAVRQILTRDRNAGVLTHLPMEDRRRNAELKRAGKPEIPPRVVSTDGPQIITPDQLELVRAVILSRATTPGVKPSRHFLSGAMNCRCGMTMRIFHAGKNTRHAGATYYTCSDRSVHPGPHTAIKTQPAENKVLLTLFGLISGDWIDPAASSGVDVSTLRAAIAENAAERARLSGLLTQRGIDPAPLLAQLEELANADDALQAQLTAALASGVSADWVTKLRSEEGDGIEDADAFMAWWNTLSVERQRDYVRQTLVITVEPGRGVKRVRIDPR